MIYSRPAHKRVQPPTVEGDRIFLRSLLRGTPPFANDASRSPLSRTMVFTFRAGLCLSGTPLHEPVLLGNG